MNVFLASPCESVGIFVLHPSSNHPIFVENVTDTPESGALFENTLTAINDLELTTAEFHIQTPFPGTPLFDRLEKEGRIISKDWSRYMLNNVNFKPKLMSEEQLLQGVRLLKKKFYSFNNFSRMILKKEDMNPNMFFGMAGSHFLSKMKFRYSDL